MLMWPIVHFDPVTGVVEIRGLTPTMMSDLCGVIADFLRSRGFLASGLKTTRAQKLIIKARSENPDGWRLQPIRLPGEGTDAGLF